MYIHRQGKFMAYLAGAGTGTERLINVDKVEFKAPEDGGDPVHGPGK